MCRGTVCGEQEQLVRDERMFGNMSRGLTQLQYHCVMVPDEPDEVGLDRRGWRRCQCSLPSLSIMAMSIMFGM